MDNRSKVLAWMKDDFITSYRHEADPKHWPTEPLCGVFAIPLLCLTYCDAAAGCAETFLASSPVAARVNVSSLTRGAGSPRTSRSTRATSVALLPVPGPASTLACRRASWASRASCSGVGVKSGIRSGARWLKGRTHTMGLGRNNRFD